MWLHSADPEGLEILIVGVGGLGCPAAIALSLADCRISLMDPDRVELSNLHRQILFRESDIGQFKAQSAARVLREEYSADIRFVFAQAFGAEHAAFLAEFDVVLDCTDQWTTKLLIADLCCAAQTPYVFAGVVGLQGHVLGVQPYQSTCLRCIFQNGPEASSALTCENMGILGPVAGVVGAQQAEVALKLCLDPQSVVDQLWTYDAGTGRERILRFRRMSDCLACAQRLSTQTLAAAHVQTQTINHDVNVLDISHLSCPWTFVQTRKTLARMTLGERLWVHFVSDETSRLLPASLKAAGHRVLEQHFDGSSYRLLVECAASTDEDIDD